MSDSIVVGSIEPELVAQAAGLLDLANGYAIVSPEMRCAASDDLKRIKKLQREVEEQRTSITQPINEGLRRVNAMFKKPLAWLDEAERALKRSCLAWDNQIERERREAARLELAAGNLEAHAALKETAAMTAPVPVAPVVKQAGESHREVWRAEVDDLMALCKAIVAGRAPLGCIEANMTVLNGYARAYKGAATYDGVRMVAERILASRAS